MIIYKITLSIFGDDFFPSKLPDINEMNLRMVDTFNPIDKRNGDNKEYGYGNITYMHDNIFATRDALSDFNQDFVNFIETYYKIFEEFKAQEYHIFTEVYYSGEQCNFEILSFSLLNRALLNLSIAYPVSVYKMKKKEIKHLLDKSTHWG